MELLLYTFHSESIFRVLAKALMTDFRFYHTYIKKGMLVVLRLCILLPDSLFVLLSWLLPILLTEAKDSSLLKHIYRNSSKLKDI